MDYFSTTYSRDYKWPVALKADENIGRKKPENTQEMMALQLEHLGPKCKGEEVSEETVLAQTEPPPQGEASKYDQPNAYLEKLFTKYPYLYNVMKFTSTNDMAKRVMSEKYKTTYQIDYNQIEDFSTLVDVVKEGGTVPTEEVQKTGVCLQEGLPAPKCQCAQGLAFTPCQCAKEVPVRRIAWKPAPISKIPRVPQEKKSKKSEGLPKPTGHGGHKVLNPYGTEYAETIGKIGSLIIKNKLLHKETIEANADNNPMKKYK